jgi:hypothetical protein
MDDGGCLISIRYRQAMSCATAVNGTRLIAKID